MVTRELKSPLNFLHGKQDRRHASDPQDPLHLSRGPCWITAFRCLQSTITTNLLSCVSAMISELLLVQGHYKTASLLSRLYGIWICLGTDADSRAKAILKNKYKEQSRVSHLASQHWGSRDPCVTIAFHTPAEESCPQPSWIQALLLY